MGQNATSCKECELFYELTYYFGDGAFIQNTKATLLHLVTLVMVHLFEISKATLLRLIDIRQEQVNHTLLLQHPVTLTP
jgi:hypothetical protein